MTLPSNMRGFTKISWERLPISALNWAWTCRESIVSRKPPPIIAKFLLGANETAFQDLANPELAAFSPDGKILAVANGTQLHQWNLATGTSLHAADNMAGPVLAVQMHGHHLLTRDRNFGLALWDLRTSRLQRRFSRERTKVSSDDASDGRGGMIGPDILWFGGLQAISSDGTRLAAFWKEGPVHVWDLVKGKLLPLLKKSETVTCLAFSPNGKLLAGQGEGGDVWLWNTTTGKVTQRLKTLAEQQVLALQFSPDGRTLAASFIDGKRGREGEVYFWELASGNVRRRLSVPALGKNVRREDELNDDLVQEPEIVKLLSIIDNTAFSFLYTPDGKHLAAAGLRSIRWWDSATCKEIRQFGSRELVGQSAVLSPDGKLLAAGMGNGDIRFWDTASGAVLRDAPAHKAMVTSLARFEVAHFHEHRRCANIKAQGASPGESGKPSAKP